VGPAAVMEETTDEYSTYFTIRFTERWEQKISETAKFWEQVDYLPPVDDFTGNFLINAEVGLEVTINSRLALREVFTWNFDNEPDENRRSYDLKSVTSLVYKF
jgi:putative salt-induced outer membrane protein YdiY